MRSELLTASHPVLLWDQHVSRTRDNNNNNNMSLHKHTGNHQPLERSQAGEAAMTDRTQTCRLYPSLPNIDSVLRYEVQVPLGSSRQKLHPAADHHLDSLLKDNQSEVSAASADVRMKAQILMLEEQRQELLSINERWAKEYRIMKQFYKDKVRDLKASLELEQNQSEEEICEEGQRNITAKDKDSTWAGEVSVSFELLKAEKEARELRAKNSALTRRGQHQHEEIRRLNKALQEALQNTQPLQGSNETLQDIWKHQAEVYKEDFLKEREDREKLKEKYLELEKKFRKVYSELRVLKPQVTHTLPPQPAHECTCTHQAKSPNSKVQGPNWQGRPINQHHSQPQRHCTHNKL